VRISHLARGAIGGEVDVRAFLEQNAGLLEIETGLLEVEADEVAAVVRQSLLSGNGLFVIRKPPARDLMNFICRKLEGANLQSSLA